MRLIVLCAALFAFCAGAFAAVPPALNEWRDWVLATHPDAECPRQASQLDRRRCAWPGRLELAVDATGAQFSQRWTVYGESWVTLPGDRELWPLEVTSNGRAAAVLERDGRPALRLDAGSYELRGRWRWQEAPQSLAVPADTALLGLTLNGAVVAIPALDEAGRLWLRPQEQSAAGADDAAKLEVFRLLRDDIPLRLDTVLRLSVAGKPRELLLGRALLADAEPLQFDSPLPARIEADGRLRVQVRAGEWELRLRSRFTGVPEQFRMERLDDGWPAQEIWAFAADPALRRVQVGGAPTVDPSQLDLPAEFANLPTFLLAADSTLKLDQQYRGDAAPAANELQLERTLWLDFEGAGATVLDRIDGRMSQGWRLQAQPALALGRVSVNGEPQLVTRLQPDGPAGVEVRDPELRVEALSRVDALSALDASGWDSDFQRVRLALQLPPGWKLWHAAGPDQVENSWLAGWDLWDIFLALLIVGACFRVLGPRWAAVAAVGVALAFHERESPVALLLPLLAVVALLRVLGAGRLRGWLLRTGYLLGLLLALAVLAFAVEQVRQGIYPQLERGDYATLDEGGSMVADTMAAAPMEEEALAAAAARQEVEASMVQRKMMAPPAPAAPPRPRYQPDANVQTGPGQPAWSWRSAQLEWSGPVKAGQPLDLYVTGPWLTRLLKFLEVILVTALAVALGRALLRARPALPAPGGGAPLAAVLLGACVWSAQPPVVEAAEFPPEALLQEFQQRLLQAPACAPDCATINALDLRLEGDQLRLRLDVSAGTGLGLPLPVTAGWQPRTVLVDDRPADGLARQTQALLLPLSAGRHAVVLEGPVASDELSLQFALAPRYVSVAAEQWEVFGLARQGLAANTLQLQKRERSARGDALLADAPKPFVLVQREIRMDLDWQVTTTVTRLAPAQGAINLSVPLLPGESVISADTTVADGKVAVSLGARQAQSRWRSVLPAAAKLTLNAPETAQWVESWVVAPSPRWHVEGSGLTPIKGEGGDRLRWRPWPGETLTLAARQPAAVSGAVTTVERAALTLAPGRRSAALSLDLAISSSVGGDYALALQEPGELKRVTVNGVELGQAGGEAQVLLPLTPGSNQVSIGWELPRGVGLHTATPNLALTSPATNVTLQLELPQDRWPLWLQGPTMGPAMLYWGVLVVIIAVAFGLAALVRRLGLGIPLGAGQWLLLGIGMSTVNLAGSVVVVLWFFALEARRRLPMPALRWRHNLIQAGLALWSLLALACLFATVPESLLAAPDMQVTGNGSHNYMYRWYQDHSGGQLPQAAVISLPLWVYRLAMLAWSLWLTFALLRWVKWGWQAFSQGQLWLPKAAPARPATPAGDQPG